MPRLVLSFLDADFLFPMPCPGEPATLPDVAPDAAWRLRERFGLPLADCEFEVLPVDATACPMPVAVLRVDGLRFDVFCD